MTLISFDTIREIKYNTIKIPKMIILEFKTIEMTDFDKNIILNPKTGVL